MIHGLLIGLQPPGTAAATLGTAAQGLSLSVIVIMALGVYVLERDRQSPEHDRTIPNPVRGRVLQRDGYACTKCGWTHAVWNRSDPRHPELHHKKHHVIGGENTEENLTTLCTLCHDDLHRQK